MSKAVYAPLLQEDLSDDEVEFSIHDTHKVRCSTDAEGQKKVLSERPAQRTLSFYLLAVLTVVVVVLSLVLAIVIVTKRGTIEDTIKPSLTANSKSSHPDWQVIIDEAGTESCVRTPDIDGDGLDDVLVGLARAVNLDRLNALKNLKEYCKQMNETYPCLGYLLALRGYDGKELWRLPTKSNIIFILCGIDLNFDGFKDCVVSGRMSAVQAVDIRHGKTLWYSDGTEYPEYFNQLWNVYQPIKVPDIDGDTIPELVITHGGDPNMPPEDRNRSPGRVMILSGKTGHPLGNYIEMPDNKETYMSPVIYQASDGSQYLLVGSGGETVQGDLMAISLLDLFLATGQKVVPSMRGAYKWKEKFEEKENMMILYRGSTKGIMVPPAIVDVNNDGEKDILIHAFDGVLTLMDGKSLTRLWTRTFPGQESYSTPAPGYYNDDDVLDFMVHWSYGEWPDYNSSKPLILDGKDGSVLWEDTGGLYQMSSDLVVRSKDKNFDHFIVKTRKSNVSIAVDDQAHGVGVQRVIHKRHGDSDETEDSDLCKVLIADYTKKNGFCGDAKTEIWEDVYILNRKLESGVSFHQTRTEQYRYNFTPEPQEESCVPVDKTTGIANMCVPQSPDSRSTDCITDVEGDGKLDLIHISQIEARVRNTRFSFLKMKFKVILSKINIYKAVTQQNSASKSDLTFAPLPLQPWLGYLGSAEDSTYYKHKTRS